MNPLSLNSPKNLLVILAAFAFAFLYSLSARALTFPTISGSVTTNPNPVTNQPVKVESEEALTINTVKSVGPAVVTVVGTMPQQPSFYDPFFSDNQDQGGQTDQIIGSGFIISDKGLVVTNKHVISQTGAKYQIITADDKKYDIQNIYRDPKNDIAIIKIDPSQNGGSLKAVSLGDSSNLQVGQYVIAIGTALGQFRNTVTTGIISGLGRGIEAGSAYQGEAENLNGLIQTNAAINPGNSGGPLINDNNQVIGINTAVAADGQNIGFALPISIVKQTLTNYNLANFSL